MFGKKLNKIMYITLLCLLFINLFLWFFYDVKIKVEITQNFSLNFVMSVREAF